MYGKFLKQKNVETSLDPFEDLVSWVGYLISNEYTKLCLINTHGFSKVDAVKISSQITHHAQMAQSLLRKSINSTDETAFLDGYYGVLNLMKLYILFSKNFNELSKNKLHGVTYKPCNESPDNFSKDQIILKTNGAMSLFYKTLTGDKITSDITLTISDVLEWVSGCSYEYQISTGMETRFLFFNTNKDEINGRVYGCLNLVNSDGHNSSQISKTPILGKLTEHPNKSFWYVGRETTRDELIAKLIPDLVDSNFIYRNSGGYICTPFQCTSLKMIQELPIALFFFSMSCITRYYPSYACYLRDSKWGPFLFAAQRHALLEFLILFWSYLQKEDYFLNGK